MRYITTRQATKVTGLSTAKLREWTSRRALIPADVPPKSQGSPARYSWQTILLLRIAVTLRHHFHLQLQAHRALFGGLRRSLQGTSFIALWDKDLVVHGADDWSLVDKERDEPLRGDAILVRLNPHLAVLSEEFVLPNPSKGANQLNLFTATGLGKPIDQSSTPSRREDLAGGDKRRRSA